MHGWKKVVALLVVALFAATLAAQAGAANKKPLIAKAPPAGVVGSDSAPALSAAAVDAGQKAVGHKPTVEQALKAYWTADRMEAAIDADQQPGVVEAAKNQKDKSANDSNGAKDAAGKGQKPAPAGPAGKVEGKEALSASPALSQAVAPKAWQPGYAYWQFPARTAGKVFFTNASNGLNYVCSATIVYSEGRDEVWTAGHCVHGGAGGTWHYNWTFVPSYSYGWAPYGYWYAKQLWTRSDWISSSDFSNDMGVAIMWPNYSGWHIADYLGGQGIAWNQSKYQTVYSFGYPAAYPFDGQSLWNCYGGTFPEWTFLWWSANTIGLPCNMTGGSSGGGWLAWFNGTSGYVNGHNDYKYDSDPNTMYSPYYGDNAGSLFNATRYL
jgi:hypothetical protein